MMLYAASEGELEVRKRASGALALAGRFPYGRAAVLSDGGRTGRPRKEIIASRAFSYRVELPAENIHLLVGHDFNRPLASRAAGTLKLRDADDALTFTADITEDIASTTWARDAIAAVGAGLMVGLSPGFRIPPKRAVAEPETIAEEPDDGQPSPIDGKPQRGAIIRTVLAALLYELSLVTVPAYSEAQVEARSWSPTVEPPDAGLTRALSRWRP
jgi:phage head maturation protease